MSFYLLAIIFFYHANAQITTKQCIYSQEAMGLCPYDQKKNSSISDLLTLRLPVHAKRVLLDQIVQNNDIGDIEIKELLALQEKDLDRLRVSRDQKYLNFNFCKLRGNQVNYVQFINITDQEISRDGWYLLCLEFDAIENRSSDHFSVDERCTDCAMIRGDQNVYSANYLEYGWVNDGDALINGDGVLRFLAADFPHAFPFPAVKINCRVIDTKEKKELIKFEQVIKPAQQVFIRVPNAANKETLVVTHVMPLNKNGTEMKIGDHPLILFHIELD